MVTLRRLLRGSALALLFASLACSQILGLEDAELAPGADAGTGGNAALGTAGLSGRELTLCQRFCRTVIEACGTAPEPGTLAVYDSQFVCERQCEAFDIGAPGDSSGNSAHCRLTHAELARDFPGERRSECPAAGPGGDGVCGDNCEGYCSVMLAECSDYDSRETCLASCRDVPDLGGFDISIVEGDSLQCRLYHLNAAAVSPENHCPHAAGAFPCAPATD